MIELEREYNPYTDLTPHEHTGVIKAVNLLNMRCFRKDHEDFPADLNKVCIAVTGSDGKLERHSQSRTELMLIMENELSESKQKQYSDWYKNINLKATRQIYIVEEETGIPEIKIVKDSQPLSCITGQETSFFPDRTINAAFVLGNEEILKKAKAQVFTEAASDDDIGRKIRDHMKDQLRNYKNALEQGIYHKSPSYSLSPAHQYYDEHNGSFSEGFKVSGLRPIQRKLDMLTIKAIRNNMLTIEEAVSFPTNTIERLSELKKYNIVPSEMPVENSYSWFLQKYHHAQQEYRKTRSKVVVPFNKDEFLKHKNVTQDFCNLSWDLHPQKEKLIFNKYA